MSGPSALSLLGLVRHLTDVERGWFRRGAAGVKGPQVGPICSSDEQPEGHTDEVDDADPAAMFAAYNDEVERCRAATAGVPLDRLAGEHSVRWIDLHMLEEYAHHDGHADLHRDRIDGTTGDWRVPCRSFEAHEKLGGSSVRQEAM